MYHKQGLTGQDSVAVSDRAQLGRGERSQNLHGWPHVLDARENVMASSSSIALVWGAEAKVNHDRPLVHEQQCG